MARKKKDEVKEQIQEVVNEQDNKEDNKQKNNKEQNKDIIVQDTRTLEQKLNSYRRKLRRI